MRKNILWLLIGIFLIVYATWSIFSGNIIGFFGGSSATREVSFSSDPVEFILMCSFQYGLGF